MSKLNLKIAAPTRSVERRALADAIEEFARRRQYLDEIGGAIAKARDRFYELCREVEAAETALAEAKESEQANKVAALLGRGDPDALSVADAQRVFDDKTRELDAVRENRRTLEAEKADAEHRVDFGRMARTTAIRAVVANDPATAELLAEFERRHKAMVDTGRALQHLSSNFMLPHDTHWRVERDWTDLAGAAPWQAAIAALETDPDAPLPASAAS